MKIKKVFISLCLVFSMAFMTGCSSDPREVVDQCMKNVQKYDFSTIDSKELDETLNSDDAITNLLLDYFKECAAKMEYTIKDSKVDGDKATVSVDATYVDASSLLSQAMTYYLSRALQLAFTGASEEELNQIFVTAFNETKDSYQTKTATCTIQFECTKDKDGWKITNVSNEFYDVITANAYSYFESFDSSETKE
ncbi:MAG: hypothetical protein HUJ53_06810 [Holdemanella sp.]|nr:hypothetical protein [Holdemanella sp.]